MALLDTWQVATILGVSMLQVWCWADDGLIDHVIYNGLYRFQESAVVSFRDTRTMVRGIVRAA